jgi:hypothetical protein
MATMTQHEKGRGSRLVSKGLAALISVAIAITVAAITFAVCWFAPNVADHIHDGSVARVCAKASVGMSRPTLNEVLHRHNSYTSEQADFARNQYSYSGYDATCVVTMDPDSDRVARINTVPASGADARSR